MKRVLILFSLFLSLPALASAGRCRLEDRAFHSEEGGCLDFRSGLVWSRNRSSAGPWDLAETHCSELRRSRHDGYGDWQLPTDAELRQLAAGRGALEHLSFPVLAFFWSSSRSPDGAWRVSLADAGDSSFSPLSERAEAICRREPADRDRDKVPDSSDRCSRTPSGDLVETVGDRKGCAANDQLYRVLPAGACPQLSEGTCRAARGCGWAPTARRCIDVTIQACSNYPEEWWCRLTPGCGWESGACLSQ